MKKLKKNLLRAVIGLSALYLILLIPDGNDSIATSLPNKKPFEWNQDSLWRQMENNFLQAKQISPKKRDSIVQLWENYIDTGFESLGIFQVWGLYNNPEYQTFRQIENYYFNLAPYATADTNTINSYIKNTNLLRGYIKHQSQTWDVTDTTIKNSLYELLYGLRAATEEVMLQSGTFRNDSTNIFVQDEKSATPSINIFGVQVHSGDMLVSRGGAEVSALISRGNDYPGNFSHVALVYVNGKTKTPYLIEAHIEKGVAIATAEQYMKDKKLRIMVLRLRHDLPAMKKDSLLPHKAAKIAYEAAQRRHIPYDFKMNFYDSSAMFCSEVASYAYKTQGIQLWQSSSTISSPGVVNWLQSFGVENFTTQMPSDLEYEPQLSIVAEWRDLETLYKDHIDNAAMDALLEKANSGEKISYNIWMLPVARSIKAWCWVKNQFGKEGLIPEGMSATRALKNETFVAMHKATVQKVQQQANEFAKQNGYRPPYWQLVKFAQQAVK